MKVLKEKQPKATPNTTTFRTQTSALIQRLKTEVCELCGAEGKTVMHHVRTLKDLKGNNEWEQQMFKRHRKTLAVCETCNAKIHVR